MKIFSTLWKFLLKKLSDSQTKRDTIKAQKTAYKTVGKKMRKARMQHKRINGKAAYRSEFNKEMKKVKENEADRLFIIGSL